MNRMQTEAEALGQEPPSYRNVVARLELPEFKTAPAHFRRIFFDTRAGRQDPRGDDDLQDLASPR